MVQPEPNPLESGDPHQYGRPRLYYQILHSLLSKHVLCGAHQWRTQDFHSSGEDDGHNVNFVFRHVRVHIFVILNGYF